MIILSALGGTVAALPLDVVYISLCSATRLYNYGGYISHAFCYENTIALYFRPPKLQDTIYQGGRNSATLATIAT